MFNIGTPELLIIFVVILIVFGPKKLPEIGRSIGKALREFKKGAEDLKEIIEQEPPEEIKEEVKKKLSKKEDE